MATLRAALPSKAFDTFMAARYLRIGFFKQPSFESLENMVQNLDTEVGIALEDSGQPIRPSR